MSKLDYWLGLTGAGLAVGLLRAVFFPESSILWGIGAGAVVGILWVSLFSPTN